MSLLDLFLASQQNQDAINHSFVQTQIQPHLHIVDEACRDNEALEEAKDLVPIARLLQDNIEMLEEPDYKDRLLTLVVDWFANEFFSWFEVPGCEKCSSQMIFYKREPNAERKLVEHYKCQQETCDFVYQFIRHNEPYILLKTRRGRCGEWANCFMTILRALDYETRIVFDSTDHVWNEVWSSVKERWLHVDPCENIVDEPLLYEVGWSKKLEYCIAFGQHEVLDVTRRYCIKYNEETVSRRTQCDERWLEQYLNRLTEDRLKIASSKELQEASWDRRRKDIEFLRNLSMTERKIPTKGQISGRKTGSIQWRIERGEYSPSLRKQFVINVSSNGEEGAKNDDDDDERSSLFELSYDCDKNIYSFGNQTKKGFSTMTYEYENVDFKYERDWKTSYLARYETCPCDKVGMIKWRFGLTDLSETWKRLEILICGKVYPGTRINVSLVYYEHMDSDKLGTKQLELGQINQLIRGEDLDERTNFVDLIVTLLGGCKDDEVAWQKPQLFRQTRGQNADERPFLFKVFASGARSTSSEDN